MRSEKKREKEKRERRERGERRERDEREERDRAKETLDVASPEHRECNAEEKRRQRR